MLMSSFEMKEKVKLELSISYWDQWLTLMMIELFQNKEVMCLHYDEDGVIISGPDTTTYRPSVVGLIIKLRELSYHVVNDHNAKVMKISLEEQK